MESPAHNARGDARALKTTRKLVRRYLDPGKSWDAARDAQLWALLRAHPACADHYREATAVHRLLVGGDADLPSGFEQRRRMSVAVAGASATQPRGGAQRRWLAVAAAIATTAAIAAVVVPSLVSSPEPGEWLQARGLGDGALPARLVGLGVAGVTEDAVEYEVVATDQVFIDDYLRLTYTNEREDLGYLFVFGIQPERPVGEQLTWIAPIPGEGESVPIDFGRFQHVPFEVHVGARHVPGPLVLVSVFTARPMGLDDVGQALDGADLGTHRSSDAIADILRDSRRLRLPSDAVIQTLTTTVVPGSQAEGSP